MDKAIKLRIKKDCEQFFNHGVVSNASLYRFVLSQARKARKEVLTEAMHIFEPHRQKPMTGNVVNLELQVLRDHKK